MRYAPDSQTIKQPAPRVYQNHMHQHQQPAPGVQHNKPPVHQSSASKTGTPPKREEKKCPCCEKREKNLLEKFLPENIYNPKTKKLFGILSPEELLLASLIFLFADSERDDSNLLCLALLYLLFADKFDLSAFLK